ncbi:GAP family protein [Amycolatopsis acidicola]|uniref:GAP family protein n=1 Tax=Amycolatopsis acidicola TaxID=2596893 RepID=A0A5N0V8A6_9PSEU|nr:GAP family protein [Amycolatopsis acidicola]KAA9162587.1 GAP family protein [Amycolatopsis acidicola]
MGDVLGDLLPLALGVAISPVPVIAVILMLLAPKAGATSAGFLGGWVAGIVVATVVFLVLAEVAGLGDGGGPSTAASWIKLVLGLVIVLLGAKQWRGRPREGEEATLPKWMAAIDTFTAMKATGLGFLLSAVNPKNLAMTVAAGVTLGALPAGQAAIGTAVFTVLAASTVAAPVVAYALAAESMAKVLDRLRTRLVQDNAVITAVLLVTIGVMLAGKGIGGVT